MLVEEPSKISFGLTYVNEISLTSTSSYVHLLKSLMVPISDATSLGRGRKPLWFSTSTSAVSDMLGNRLCFCNER